MCDPVSIGLSTFAASMAAQAGAQSSAAKSQNRYRSAMGEAQNKQFEQTVESVQRDIGLQVDTLVAQRLQVIDQQRQELQNITRDARQSSASFRAAQAEMGVEGRTVELAHQQFERDVLDFESAATRNVTNYTAQINREAQAIYSRGQSIINSGYPSPLPPPAQVNYGLIAVNAATSGLNAGLSSYSAFTNPNPGQVSTSSSGTGTAGMLQGWNSNLGNLVGGNP